MGEAQPTDIEFAAELRRVTERQIQTLLDRYQQETGCPVVEVELTHLTQTDRRLPVILVTLHARIP